MEKDLLKIEIYDIISRILDIKRGAINDNDKLFNYRTGIKGYNVVELLLELRKSHGLVIDAEIVDKMRDIECGAFVDLVISKLCVPETL